MSNLQDNIAKAAWRRAGRGSILAASLGLAAMCTAAAPPANAPARLPNPFFAMDTSIRGALRTTPDRQVAMVRALGYDGISIGGTGNISDVLRALDANGLKLFAQYINLSIDDPDAAAPDAALEDAMRRLERRDTALWVTLASARHAPSAVAGDIDAIPFVRRLADAAAAHGLRVVLYPHAGMWMQRVEDAIRVAQRVDRPNVGITFNLCHWLKTAPHQELVSILRRATPWLELVSINGADAEAPDWTGLIQTLDRGSYDVSAVLATLRALGYTGPIGFQGFGIGGDPEDNLRRTMAAWQRLSATAAARPAALPAPDARLAELLDAALLEAIRTHVYGRADTPFRVLETRLRDASPDERDMMEKVLLDTLHAADVTPFARQRLCRVLRRWGTAQAVPVLAGLLDDPVVGHLALDALQANAAPAVAPALREALDRLTGPRRLEVIACLGSRRDALAVPGLERLLAHNDAPTSSAALSAIGAIGTPRALAVLTGATVPPALAAVRDRAVLRAATRLAQDHATRPPALEAIRLRLEQGATPAVRVAALSALAAADGATAVPAVMAALRAPEAHMRGAAARLLEALPGDIGAAVSAALPSLSADTQLAVVSALAARGDRAASAAIAALLDAASSADVQAAAAEALSTIGGAADVPRLLARAVGTNVVAKAARRSLSVLPGPGVDAALLKALDAGNEDTVVLVAELAEARGMTVATPHLLRLARERTGPVRRAALSALVRMATQSDLPGLIALAVGTASPDERTVAARAARATMRRASDRSAAVTTVLEALRNAAGPARTAVLELLTGCDDERALHALTREALDGADREARQAAVRALAAWPDATPLDALRAIAERHKNTHTGILALRACISLIGAVGGPPPAEAATRLGAILDDESVRMEERRLALAELGRVPDIAAVDRLERELDRPGTRDEARAALVAALRLLGNTAATRDRVTRLSALPSTDAGFREHLQELLKSRVDTGGCLTAWAAAGPYSADAGALFDTAFPPEQTNATDVTWRPVDTLAGPFTKYILPGDVNLGALFGGTMCAAYLRTSVYCPDERDATLKLGSDDGIKAWLNGALVHAKDARRACARGSDSVPVHLRRGWNVLMLKVTQQSGEWGASAMLVASDGKPFDDLAVKAL